MSESDTQPEKPHNPNDDTAIFQIVAVVLLAIFCAPVFFALFGFLVIAALVVGAITVVLWLFGVFDDDPKQFF